MKILALSTAALALAAPVANAASFTPANISPITISGSMRGGYTLNCPFTMTAAISGGVITVLSATACAGVVATRLPWTWTAHSLALNDGYAWMSFSANGVDCGYYRNRISMAKFNWIINPSKSPTCVFGGGAFTTTPVELGLK